MSGADAAVRVLALSGSLRRASVNTALLGAASVLAPAHVKVEFGPSHADLPHFNPDTEETGGLAVEALRAAVQRADALLIACPEYAHGLPGSFKNMLDWLVGSGELSGKPVTVLSASARALHAPPALIEVLGTMDAQVVPPEAVIVAASRLSTREDILALPEACAVLRSVMDRLVATTTKAGLHPGIRPS